LAIFTWIKQGILQNKEISLLLLGLTIFRFIYICFIPITPQEAYYWYYSLYPDFSYFDHPPMAAYSIWIGTHIFGHTIFGVKFMGVIWSLLTNILIYLTLKIALDGSDETEKKKIGLIAVILYNLTIFAHLYAIIIVPDTPLLFFWMAVIYLFVKYLKTGKAGNFYMAGIALGFGLISKYTAIAIVPAILVILLLDKDHRKILLKPHPYLALLFAAAVFSIVIYWNIMHDWASIKFQFADRSTGLRSFQTKYLFQLIASQIFVLTPLPLVIFIMALKRVTWNWRSLVTERTFMITGIFIIGGFILVSLRSLVKMNWLLPGYLGWIIAVTLLYSGKISIKSLWMKVGVFISLILIIIAYSLLIVPNIPLGEGNTWSGWRESAQEIGQIQQERGGEKTTFLFTNSYKSAALLRFYLPQDQEVYAQNIFGEPALQFDIWGIPDSLQGKNALFVCTDRYEYGGGTENLNPYFEEINLVEKFDFFFMDSVKTRSIICYEAMEYKGPDL